jgi:transcriptional regulator with XRE-family HTH domain
VETLGSNLKTIRTAQGLTLAQLGGKAGLSASYLSQVERGVTMPSLSRLTGIAQALGVEVRVFFEDDASSPCVVRANEGIELKGSAGISMELLSAHPRGKNIQPYIVVCPPGAWREHPSVHPGEECGFVVKGELTVTVGEETFTLAAGDSIHYDRHQLHSWRNAGDEECVAIWATFPPIPEAELSRWVGGWKGGGATELL